MDVAECRRWLAAAVACAIVAAPSAAHVVYGSTTLNLLTQGSDLVARVRIVDPEAVVALAEPAARDTVVVAQVLATWKGESPGEEIRFIQHGHGVALYEPGDEVVVFLKPVATSFELSNSPVASRVQWVSEEDSGQKFPVDDSNRAAFDAAIGAYAGLEALPLTLRTDALRRITVQLLRSPHAALASSALRDLVLAPSAPLVTQEDVPVLDAWIADAGAPIGLRLGVLAELERRGLVDAAPRWAALVRDSDGADRIAAIRAAGAHPGEAVSAELAKWLKDSDPMVAGAAAISIGAPGNARAVAPLAELLASDEPRVRMAAIRGLGRVGTQSARRALAEAGASHPDPATRRRAEAELRILGGAATGATDGAGSAAEAPR